MSIINSLSDIRARKNKNDDLVEMITFYHKKMTVL